VRRTQEPVLLDLALHDDSGGIVALSRGIPVRAGTVRLVELAPLDDFHEALQRRAGSYALPEAWSLPTVAEGDRWYATGLTRQQWRGFGMADEGFISEGLPGGSQAGAYVEVGGDTPCAPLHLALSRGRARQQGGQPWGVTLNNQFREARADTRYRDTGELVRWMRPSRARGPHCGHSPSLEFRFAMAARLAGATSLRRRADAPEGSMLVQETAPGQFALSPFGAAVKALHTYAQAYPERGVPYTPIAFLTEGREGPAALLRHAFGCHGATDSERGYVPSSPYGHVFDIVAAGDGARLGDYGVVWPLGEAPASPALREDPALRDVLLDYAEGGGILVLDASWAATLPYRTSGVRFAREAAVATQIQTALAPVPALTAPFTYRPMALGRKTGALAWTDSGDPVLVWRAAKEGLIVVLATDDWLDEGGRLLPLAPALLRALTDAFVPVDVVGGALTFFNRTDAGWVIGVINSNGITKTPTTRAVADPKETADCFVRFREGVPLRFTSRLGEFRWNNVAKGLHVRLGPGEVGVAEVVLGGV